MNRKGMSIKCLMARWWWSWLTWTKQSPEYLRALVWANTPFLCTKQSKLGAYWTLRVIAACCECEGCNPCRSGQCCVPSCGEQCDASHTKLQLQCCELTKQSPHRARADSRELWFQQTQPLLLSLFHILSFIFITVFFFTTTWVRNVTNIKLHVKNVWAVLWARSVKCLSIYPRLLLDGRLLWLFPLLLVWTPRMFSDPPALFFSSKLESC